MVIKAEVCPRAGSATWSFPFKNLGLLWSIEFFSGTGPLPHLFCHNLFSPYGYVHGKQCPIVLLLYRTSVMQIIGSPPVPGNLVFVFRPPIKVHRHLKEFHLCLQTNIYLAPLFNTIIFIQPSPCDLIHSTCILVVIWALESYFCIHQSIRNCYSFYPWLLPVLKSAITFESPTDVLIGPQCFSAPISSHSWFK